MRKIIIHLCSFAFVSMTAAGLFETSLQARTIQEKCANFVKLISDGKKSGREKLQLELAEKMAKWSRKFYRIPTLSEFAESLEMSPASLRKYMQTAQIKSLSDLFKFALRETPEEFDYLREKIAKTYASASKEAMLEADEAQVARALEISPEQLRELLGKNLLFKDFEAVKELGSELNPESFESVIGEEFLSDESRAALMRALGTHKRIIYTSAVSKVSVNKEMFQALISYAEKKDAIIVVRPINFQTNDLDPILFTSDRVFVSLDGIILSPNAALSKTQVLSNMIRPNIGLKRIGTRGQSQVIGATKAHVDTASTEDNSEAPHEQISSGALTEPHYSGRLPVQRRQAEIASHDHFFGAVIVERGEEKEQFHLRHIEYIPEKRGFTDLDTFYHADGSIEKVQAEALVFGDIHVGDTDPKILETIKDQIKRFKPKRIYLHDLFNGYSINHHESDKIAILAKKAEEGKLSLKGEIEENQAFLKWLLSLGEDFEVHVVKSNHDLFLDKWLNDKRHAEDPYNVRLGSELFAAMVDGKDPLEYAIKKDADFDTSRIKFLKVTDSEKVGPKNRSVELAVHGHAGPNGAKASISTLQEAADRIVVGHMHTNIRRNGTVVVGTFTKKVLDYNKDGSSNWVQSMAVVGKNGEIQVLEFKDGDWYLEREKDAAKKFSKGFPKMVNYKIPDGSGLDQYSHWKRRN